MRGWAAAPKGLRNRFRKQRPQLVSFLIPELRPACWTSTPYSKTRISEDHGALQYPDLQALQGSTDCSRQLDRQRQFGENRRRASAVPRPRTVCRLHSATGRATLEWAGTPCVLRDREVGAQLQRPSVETITRQRPGMDAARRPANPKPVVDAGGTFRRLKYSSPLRLAVPGPRPSPHKLGPDRFRVVMPSAADTYSLCDQRRRTPEPPRTTAQAKTLNGTTPT